MSVSLIQNSKVEDAARRISDTYTLHRLADPYGSIGKWFAARLTDGTTDDVLYDSKGDCVRHQHHDEDYYCFIQVTPHSMNPHEAQTMLNIQRRMYTKGLRLAERSKTGGRDMIMRVSEQDQYNQLRALFKGDAPPSNLYIPGEAYYE